VNRTVRLSTMGVFSRKQPSASLITSRLPFPVQRQDWRCSTSSSERAVNNLWHVAMGVDAGM
jgi:hypothetical protein